MKLVYGISHLCYDIRAQIQSYIRLSLSCDTPNIFTTTDISFIDAVMYITLLSACYTADSIPDMLVSDLGSAYA